MDNLLASKQASKQASKDRIDYIDLLRAIGIILMIMGHVAFGSYFKKWIHIFHMPMFFVISGYFWKDQPFLSMLKKKARTLLIPYFVFGLFHLMIQFIRMGHIDTHCFYLLLWENTAEGGVPIAGALWFLTTMFFSEILFWCVQRLKKSYSWSVTIVVSVIGMVCATYLPFRLPWALDVAMIGVGFYHIGMLLKEKWSKLLDLNFAISLACLAAFSALGFLNGYVNLRQGLYSIWSLFWINAVGVTISLWNMSRIVCGWIEKKNCLKKPMKWIKGIGRDSIIYLCLNQSMILIADHLVGFFPAGGEAMLLGEKAIILLISLIGLYVAEAIILNSKLKMIVGKNTP